MGIKCCDDGIFFARILIRENKRIFFARILIRENKRLIRGWHVAASVLGIAALGYVSYKYDAGFRSMIREGMVKVRACFQL